MTEWLLSIAIVGFGAKPMSEITLPMALVAIAIEQSCYTPDSKRSPIPTELAGVAAQLGLEPSHDTILKDLRLSAAQLPND